MIYLLNRESKRDRSKNYDRDRPKHSKSGDKRRDSRSRRRDDSGYKDRSKHSKHRDDDYDDCKFKSFI